MPDKKDVEAIVKVDEQGRVNLPASILDALHFVAPGELKAQAAAGKLELTALQPAQSVTFTPENGVLVAVNSVEFDAVSALNAVRDERL